MAEFHDTTGVSARLTSIIKNAKKRLFIISPYLRVNRQIKELLEDQDRMRIEVWVIYGKDELKPEENNWLGEMESIKRGFLQDLHAKCYMNEDEALVTSMNLYEYSQVNNYEMGISVSREKDPELYAKIEEEAERIMRACDRITVTVDKVEAERVDEGKDSKRVQPAVGDAGRRTPRKSSPTVTAPQNGFCIRCKADLPTNPTRPYCSRCYASWNRYKNEEYEEKHCHTCGNEHTATLLKPLCRACYGKYKDVLEFAAS